MNVRIKMDKAYFTGLYKWLNLMSTSVTPEIKPCLDSLLQENKEVFAKISDEEFALTEKGQGKLQIGDVVRIAKRNIYHDQAAEYVVVQAKEDIDNKKFGLLPLDHIMNEELINQHKTATAWRWFNHYNIRFVRELTETEKASFAKWKLSRTRKKTITEANVSSDSVTTLFDTGETAGV